MFRNRGFTQHETNNFIFIAWMTNSNAQAVKVGIIAQLADDVFQTIVAAVAAAKFKFRDARREIQLVVSDQNFVRL
ncbi:hypothetical protein SeGA_1917, partial [Salmonella enterica subsp. enterica serovar Gaminara str. A4-567]